MIKDILIIGCGPAGLYAWKMGADLGLSGIVVEGLATYGGQVTNNYPEKIIYNLPAILQVKGLDMVENMYQAINKTADFEAKFSTFITSIEPIAPAEDTDIYQNWFEVRFSDKTTYTFKRIVFADGVGVYAPIRLVEDDYANVAYTVTDINKYQDKNVVIFGGGDSAIDWANHLLNIAKTIKVVHRRDEFRAQPANVSLAANNGVELLTPYSFAKIVTETGDQIKQIELTHEDESQLILDCDEIIVQFGQKINKNYFENLNLAMNKVNRIEVNASFESSFSGIYAVGDCCTYPTKIRNILSSVFEAMHAVIDIEKIVHKRKVLNVGW